MKFELEDSLRGAPDEALLDDIRRCAKLLQRDTLTLAEYGETGKAHASTIQRRFGSWVKALELAGLQPSRSKIGISEEELFNDIKNLWMTLGRQPRYSEMRAPATNFSAETFAARFGSWSGGLARFVAWVNADDTGDAPQAHPPGDAVSLKKERAEHAKRRSRREISDRQRFRTLVRDGFRCKSCGVSPLNKPGTELHVDHIIPWSKGGETVDENLETKCLQCNLGKGNAFDV
ncbi:MAG: HNH endonuclease [Hyphomicrobiaceae bacterium]|nr:HNH endonuclease [Hyphomicrobiaceae bacterium]